MTASEWAEAYLLANNYFLSGQPVLIQTTPWSQVIQLNTTAGAFYVKQTPAALFLEPRVIQLMANQLDASVAVLVASNEDLHCFLMQDAGQSLRRYLKARFEADLLYRAVKVFTAIQRSAESQLASFLAIGVPDWRLDKLPVLYNQLINQTGLLKSEGMTDQEIASLYGLSNTVAEQCLSAAQYHIPATLVQPDFNTNNMLIDPDTKKMSLVDIGEIAISHPFFSLYNFLYQASIHHGIKKADQVYSQLEYVCYENWLELGTIDEVAEAFRKVRKLWPIYGALAQYRLMLAVDRQALRAYYPDRPNKLAEQLREYIRENING